MTESQGQTPTDRIICGDALGVLAGMKPESVDLVVTSPPYDDLRDYNGYSFDFEYIAQELVTVLKRGGVIVWVVGDSTIRGSETGTSFKQALYFKEIGLNLHDTMIYAKANYPPLTHNRYEQQFEYMFVFSKGGPKTFNPIKKRNLLAGYYNNSSTNRNKDGTTSKFNKPNYITTESIRPNIWNYTIGANHSTKEAIALKHPATFPEQLAADHILSWSNEGDTVLDPFNGSGTTTKMAYKLNRKYIGIDISQEYCDIAEKRLQQGVLL